MIATISQIYAKTLEFDMVRLYMTAYSIAYMSLHMSLSCFLFPTTTRNELRPPTTRIKDIALGHYHVGLFDLYKYAL